jgi:hypothetical protein
MLCQVLWRPDSVMRGDAPVHRWLIVPNASVPLADEAAPVFNVEIGRLPSDAEGCGLVCADGCGEDIDAVKAAWRKLQVLAVGRDRVGGARRRWSELEPNAVVVDVCRQHLRRERIAVPVEAGGACL